MKKTLITIGLALVAGITLAQSLPTIEITRTNVPVVTLAPAVTLVAVTNQVRVTNTVSRKMVAPMVLSEAQMSGIIQMVQSSGVSASEQITTTNLQGLTLQKQGGTNGLPVTFRVNFQIK